MGNVAKKETVSLVTTRSPAIVCRHVGSQDIHLQSTPRGSIWTCPDHKTLTNTLISMTCLQWNSLQWHVSGWQCESRGREIKTAANSCPDTCDFTCIKTLIFTREDESTRCAEDTVVRAKATTDARRRQLVCSVGSTVSVCAVCEKNREFAAASVADGAGSGAPRRHILKQVDAQMCSQQQSSCPSCLYFRISQVFFAWGAPTIRGMTKSSSEGTKPGRGVKDSGQIVISKNLAQN